MKMCHSCDRILGELETDDLTDYASDSIIGVIGNIAYSYCPECFSELKVEPIVFH